jgi:4-carboxymuconolactone decarboxylase
MSRLPYLPREKLDERGQQLWDLLVETRGGRLLNDEGGLTGPFNAWLYSPLVGERAAALGASLRVDPVLDRRLIEIAIITTGAHWKAEFEWWAHARMAKEFGVSDEAIAAIAIGEEPPFLAEDERLVYSAAQQLSRSGCCEPATVERCRRTLGDSATVELVILCGYYTLVSYVLNTFNVPLPDGVDPQWEEAGSPGF